MDADWFSLAKDFGLGGGVIVGVAMAAKALKNGKPCPAEDVLDKHHEELVRSNAVREGLIEAVNRNTAASERLTDVLVRKTQSED